MNTKRLYFKLLKMCRPAFSRTAERAAQMLKRDLKMDMDDYGNLIRIIGKDPVTMFAAHYDTVHFTEGQQKVDLDKDGFITTPDGDCLGADDASGIYIMARMMKKGIKGVYVIHNAEEVGCLGSKYIADANPEWLQRIVNVVSFDRMGYSDVIDTQMGMPSCSKVFATELANRLGMSPATGVVTDSHSYVNGERQCTNLSVGYFDQHSPYETQDWWFLKDTTDYIIEQGDSLWNDLPGDKYGLVTRTKTKSTGTASMFGFDDDFDDDLYDWFDLKSIGDGDLGIDDDFDNWEYNKKEVTQDDINDPFFSDSSPVYAEDAYYKDHMRGI